MRRFQSLRLVGFAILAALSFSDTTVLAATTEAPHKGREIPVTVTSTLKNQGVTSGWAEVDPGNPLKLSVYLSFSKPFEGTIHLRGYTSAGAEAARSGETALKLLEDAGRPVEFYFPEGNDLGKVHRLIVADQTGVPVPPKPQKRDESIGQEAKDILQELTR